MELKEALLQQHSKPNTLAIARRVLAGDYAFEELWRLIKSGPPPFPQRASWVLDAVTAEAPFYLEAHLPEAVALLRQPAHNAVHRNLVKALSRIAIPEELQGEVYGFCIDSLMNPKALPAIQAFSMTLAANIARGVPELEEELALVIVDQMDFNTAAFKARGRRILSLLQKN